MADTASDLPGGVDVHAMQIAVAWQVAKRTTIAKNAESQEDYLKRLVNAYVKAYRAIAESKEITD